MIPTYFWAVQRGRDEAASAEPKVHRNDSKSPPVRCAHHQRLKMENGMGAPKNRGLREMTPGSRSIKPNQT
jgi:hypothetical protein